MSTQIRIGFLGTGKMATALAQGFLRAQLVSVQHLIGSDPAPAARESFAQTTAAHVTAENREVVQNAEVIVLAVKPNQVAAVLQAISPALNEQHLVISIAAGVRLEQLERSAPAGTRLVRTMPNTPALIGAAATGYSLGTHAEAADAQLVKQLFTAVGVAYEVNEPLLDAVTGLSGSGPAYVYQIIEALSDGGVAAGLSRDVATQLAAQTLLGASRMVLETGVHPAELKDRVTSPGGTTIEGLHQLEKAGLRNALINAVRAASRKARRLSR